VDLRAPSFEDARTAAAPALIVVNSAYDDPDTNSGVGDCSTGYIFGGGEHECTLRAAIQTANNVPGADTVFIDFNIATGPSGTYDATNDIWTIPVNTSVRGTAYGVLPMITHANVYINGETQPPASGFDPASCGALWNGTPHNLKVVVDGSNLSGTVDRGFNFGPTAKPSGLRGLVVSNFPWYGIFNQAGYAMVECLYVGTDYAGATAQSNGHSGIYVADTANVVRNNLVSGNEGPGIETYRSVGSAIEGNLVGLDVTGTAALPNPTGVLMRMGFENRIGGLAPEMRNVISGNTWLGVWDSASYHVAIEGNLIGTNRTGDGMVPNGAVGLEIDSYYGRVGGLVTEAGNVVSGNGGRGIFVGGWQTTVQGNRIGTNAAGTAALPNAGDGIEDHSYSRETLIGGIDPGAGNLISGNVGHGILVDGKYAIVEGNFIGTDIDGLLAIGNQQDGVHVTADSARIGGLDAGARNLISGNGDDGVELADTSNAVIGNYIGTDISGTAAIPNAWGVFITADRNTVGIVHPDGGNLISGNTNHGILVNSLIAPPVPEGNTVFANRIGTDAGGTTALANGMHGISDWGKGTIVGAPGEHGLNVISGNGESGIHVATVASFTEITGNLIGTDATGLLDVGNTLDGIEVLGEHVYIGGAAGTPEGNVISGNGSNGVDVQTTGNYCEIFGNLIGVDRGGNFAIPNLTGIDMRGDNGTIGGPGVWNVVSGQFYGIYVSSDVSDLNIMGNRIGTDATGNFAIPNGTGMYTDGTSVNIGESNPALRNVISGNTSDGIRIGGSAVSTTIVNNFIGTTIAGAGPLPNGWHGISGGGDDTVIGGDVDGLTNLIAYNVQDGIHIDTTPSSVSILRNAIHSNGELGIDLFGGTENADDVTENDDKDPDSGPNALQNYPTIATPLVNPGGGAATPITINLNSLPNSTFRVEVFRSSTADPSGYGEGQEFIGAGTISTDANGDGSDTGGLPISDAPIGSWITATATRVVSSVYEETSEFSPAIQIEGPQVALDGAVFLEGSYAGSGSMATPPGFHNSIPTVQPYSHPFFDGTMVDYDGTEVAPSLGANLVDWVVVELRDAALPSVAVARRAAFVRENGGLVDLDGSAPLPIYGVGPDDYYVVVCHRNHLCAMSELVDFSSGTGVFDFTTSPGYTTGPRAQKVLETSPSAVYGLFAGNANADRDVQALDFNSYLEETLAGVTGYSRSDFNMDGNVQALDFNLYLTNTLLGASSQVP
jgi:CSLREA domain-containing protein